MFRSWKVQERFFFHGVFLRMIFIYVIIQGMSSSILIGKRSSMLWGELRNCLFGEEGRVLTLGSTNANATCTFEYTWQVLQSYENLQVGQVKINILPGPTLYILYILLYNYILYKGNTSWVGWSISRAGADGACLQVGASSKKFGTGLQMKSWCPKLEKPSRGTVERQWIFSVCGNVA